MPRGESISPQRPANTVPEYLKGSLYEAPPDYGATGMRTSTSSNSLLATVAALSSPLTGGNTGSTAPPAGGAAAATEGSPLTIAVPDTFNTTAQTSTIGATSVPSLSPTIPRAISTKAVYGSPMMPSRAGTTSSFQNLHDLMSNDNNNNMNNNNSIAYNVVPPSQKKQVRVFDEEGNLTTRQTGVQTFRFKKAALFYVLRAQSWMFLLTFSIVVYLALLLIISVFYYLWGNYCGGKGMNYINSLYFTIVSLAANGGYLGEDPETMTDPENLCYRGRTIIVMCCSYINIIFVGLVAALVVGKAEYTGKLGSRIIYSQFCTLVPVPGRLDQWKLSFRMANVENTKPLAHGKLRLFVVSAEPLDEYRQLQRERRVWRRTRRQQRLNNAAALLPPSSRRPAGGLSSGSPTSGGHGHHHHGHHGHRGSGHHSNSNSNNHSHEEVHKVQGALTKETLDNKPEIGISNTSFAALDPNIRSLLQFKQEEMLRKLNSNKGLEKKKKAKKTTKEGGSVEEGAGGTGGRHRRGRPAGPRRLEKQGSGAHLHHSDDDNNNNKKDKEAEEEEQRSHCSDSSCPSRSHSSGQGTDTYSAGAAAEGQKNKKSKKGGHGHRDASSSSSSSSSVSSAAEVKPHKHQSHITTTTTSGSKHVTKHHTKKNKKTKGATTRGGGGGRLRSRSTTSSSSSEEEDDTHNRTHRHHHHHRHDDNDDSSSSSSSRSSSSSSSGMDSTSEDIFSGKTNSSGGSVDDGANKLMSPVFQTSGYGGAAGSAFSRMSPNSKRNNNNNNNNNSTTAVNFNNDVLDEDAFYAMNADSYKRVRLKVHELKWHCAEEVYTNKDGQLSLWYPCTITHLIDEKSPLYRFMDLSRLGAIAMGEGLLFNDGSDNNNTDNNNTNGNNNNNPYYDVLQDRTKGNNQNADQLRSHRFQIVAVFDATEMETGAVIVSKKTYTTTDIVTHYKFSSKLVHMQPHSTAVYLDYHYFNEVVPHMTVESSTTESE